MEGIILGYNIIYESIIPEQLNTTSLYHTNNYDIHKNNQENKMYYKGLIQKQSHLPCKSITRK